MTTEGNDPRGRMTDEPEYGQKFSPVRPVLKNMSLAEIMGCPMPERRRVPWPKVALGAIFVALLLLSLSIYAFGG